VYVTVYPLPADAPHDNPICPNVAALAARELGVVGRLGVVTVLVSLYPLPAGLLAYTM